MTQPRIATGQSVATKAKQALMVGGQELELFTFRQPYHLGYEDQRADLLETLRAEFGRTVELPPIELSSKLVSYLIVIEVKSGRGKRTYEPVLIPEVEVLPWVFGYVLGRAGREAAERVGYRPDMLTAAAT